jgi:hypothetical protein
MPAKHPTMKMGVNLHPKEQQQQHHFSTTAAAEKTKNRSLS